DEGDTTEREARLRSRQGSPSGQAEAEARRITDRDFRKADRSRRILPALFREVVSVRTQPWVCCASAWLCVFFTSMLARGQPLLTVLARSNSSSSFLVST